LREATALVDLDGTLADYHGEMCRRLELLRSPAEPPLDISSVAWRPDWLEARRQLVSNQPGFWRDLPPLPVGWDVLHILRELRFSVSVLTKGPRSKPAVWAEKVEWVRQFLPGTPLTITEDKSFTYGRVLVDDFPPYFTAWLAHRPRGIAIVPAQPWNEGAERLDPTRIFRYIPDPANLEALHRILKAVRDRGEGELIDLPALKGPSPH